MSTNNYFDQNNQTYLVQIVRVLGLPLQSKVNIIVKYTEYMLKNW